MDYESYFAQTRFASTSVWAIVVLNLLIFFILGMFFDGGAFPWGQIESGQYLINNNQGLREVPSTWFWFNFWQGFSAWFLLGIFLTAAASYDFISYLRRRCFKVAAKLLLFTLLSTGWLIFVVYEAINIAT